MESCECFSLVNQSKHPLLSFICPLWYKTTVINQSSRQQIFNKLSFWSTEGLKWRMVSARNNHIRETTGIYHLVLLCILFCFQCKLILCCLIKLNCVASISQNRCQSQQTSVVKWKLNKQIKKSALWSCCSVDLCPVNTMDLYSLRYLNTLEGLYFSLTINLFYFQIILH